ncbi:hypothetical protein KIPB_014480, partial [Kipferlia bialata]|eukprot:g14480.t1
MDPGFDIDAIIARTLREANEYTYHDAVYQKGGAITLEEIEVWIPYDLQKTQGCNPVSTGDSTFLVPSFKETHGVWQFPYHVTSDGAVCIADTVTIGEYMYFPPQVDDAGTTEDCFLAARSVDLVVQGGRVYAHHDSDAYLMGDDPDAPPHAVHIMDLAVPGP